ncbi:hypothetical protein FRC09_009795 [Ceratobasidium sp. 395]|nr:hypothetical protein FRC09_009795 [Ceratobasidium sp. 395]
MTQLRSTFNCRVCLEDDLNIESLRLIGPCGHMFCLGCIESSRAAQRARDEDPWCPTCRSARVFPEPKPVRAQPMTPRAEFEALQAKVWDLQDKVRAQKRLVDRAKNMTLEKAEEERGLIRDWDHLCAQASGSTSGEASSNEPKRARR